MKKVCFVLPSLAGGGAERVAVQVLSALDDRRWERSMYLFKREGPYLADVPAGVSLSSSTSESRLGRLLELRRYIRETRPDLVVSFLSYFTVLAAAKISGVRTRVVFVLGTPMSAFLADADYHWKTPSHRTAFAMVTRAGYNMADADATRAAGRLCGFQRNPWKYVARADVFGLTSRYEGFGNVLIEAMACGVPVVVTSSPGPLEIVRDNVDGVIVPEHTPAAVAGALEKIL